MGLKMFDDNKFYRGTIVCDRYQKHGKNWKKVKSDILTDSNTSFSHWNKWRQCDRNLGARTYLKSSGDGRMSSYHVYSPYDKNEKIIYTRIK